MACLSYDVQPLFPLVWLPAHVSDLKAGEEVLLSQTDLEVFGDKAYISAAVADQLKQVWHSPSHAGEAQGFDSAAPTSQSRPTNHRNRESAVSGTI
jgi:hypothetical protein